MEHYLVISAMGPDRTGLVDSLSSYILDHGGNIVESRMAVLGGEFALIVLVSGTEDTIATIDSGLGHLREKLGLVALSKRTTRRTIEQQLAPYDVTVVSMDHPGIVKSVADFFAHRGINIETLDTSTYPAPHMGTSMFSLKMTIGLGADQAIGKLRRDFEEFCDNLNLDATIESRR